VTTTSKVIVDVMLKPEILDPAGQAVLGAASALGHSISGIRIGKRIELSVQGVPDERALHELAGSLLSNPVIEDYELRIEA
jgi:phosphoribosylformylglycinamidine synthase PurS subunit